MLYPSELQARGWFGSAKEAELGYRNDSIADWLWALAGAGQSCHTFTQAVKVCAASDANRVPHLRRSYFLDLATQPSRAGLTCGAPPALRSGWRQRGGREQREFIACRVRMRWGGVG